MSSEDKNAESTNEAKPEEPVVGSARQNLLLGLLAILLVALGYDYLIARPAVNSAFETLAAAGSDANSKADGGLTAGDVKRLLGKDPAETFTDGDKSVEVFHYRSGLIVKPHKLFAVYTQQDDQLHFERHLAFAYEPDRGSKSSVVEMTADQHAQFMTEDEEMLSMETSHMTAAAQAAGSSEWDPSVADPNEPSNPDSGAEPEQTQPPAGDGAAETSDENSF